MLDDEEEKRITVGSVVTVEVEIIRSALMVYLDHMIYSLIVYDLVAI